MPLAKAFAALALMSLALAGCSGPGGLGGGGGASGFSVDGSGKTYTFSASGSADNYTWDLGDHLTRAYTKSVTHTYDFANGKATVVLTVTKDGQKTEHRKEVTLGTGENKNAGFVLEGSTNWTVLGETVKLSTHRSTDPDGDPLRYTWSCQRVSDAIRQSAHSHPGFGGVAFATPPAGSVLSINAQGPLPNADRTVPGDLCDGLGAGGKPTLDRTISGAFTKPGIYDIYILASDPVHPTTSGKYRIVATPAGERPAEIQVLRFKASFVAGSDGSLQSVCDQVEQCNSTFDQAKFPFTTTLAAQKGSMELTYTDPTESMEISCDLTKGGSVLKTQTGVGNATVEPANLKAGNFDVVCKPAVGLPTSPTGTAFDVVVTLDLDLDPFKVY